MPQPHKNPARLSLPAHRVENNATRGQFRLFGAEHRQMGTFLALKPGSFNLEGVGQ
jgi:hypothetical protein